MINTLLQDGLGRLSRLCKLLGGKVTRPVAGKALPDASSLAPWRELAHCSEGILQCELSLLDPIQVVINYDSICLNMKKISDSLKRLCQHYGITFPEHRSTESRHDLFNLIDTIASDVELCADARQLGGKEAIQFVKHVHTRLSYGRTHGQDCSRVLSLLHDLRWRAPGQLLLYEEKFDALLKQCKAIPGPRIIEPLESLHDKIADYRKRCSEHTLVKTIVEEPTMLFQLQQYQQSLLKIYRECQLKPPDPTIFTTDFDTISVLIREVTWIRELHIEVMKLREGDARAFMDRVQESLDRERQADVLKLLQDLSDESDELPSHMLLNGVEQVDTIPSFFGGEAHIYKCRYNDRPVVSRRVKLPPRPLHQSKLWPKFLETRKEIRREILVHRQLKNNHIIELLGVVSDAVHPLGVIMPFMENGDSVNYLEDNPMHLLPIIHGAASAVLYLHGLDPPVIHGDIRGSNILVDSKGVPKLCDFGFARFRREVSRTHTRHVEGGSDRHVAPELYCGIHDFRTTSQTDIYSLSMTLLELSTHDRPFKEFAYHGAAAMAAVEGKRPCRTTLLHLSPGVADELWSLMEFMWVHDPGNRPPAHVVLRHIERLQEMAKASASSILLHTERRPRSHIDEEETVKSPCVPPPELPVVAHASQVTSSPKPSMVDGPAHLPKTFPKETPGPSIDEVSTMHPFVLPPQLMVPTSGKDDGGPTSTSKAGRGTSARTPEELGRDDGSAITHRSPTGGIVHSTPSLPRAEQSQESIESPRVSPLRISPSRHSEFEAFPPSVPISQAEIKTESQKREPSLSGKGKAPDSPDLDMDVTYHRRKSPTTTIFPSPPADRAWRNEGEDSEPTGQAPPGDILSRNPISAGVLEPSEGNVKLQSGSSHRTTTSCDSEPGGFPDMHIPSLVQRDVSSLAPPSHSGQGQESGLGLDTAVYKGTPAFETKVLGTPLIAVPEPQDGREDPPVRCRGSSGDVLPPNFIPASDQHRRSPATSQSSLFQVTGSDASGPIITLAPIPTTQNQIDVVPRHSMSGLRPTPTAPGPNTALDQPGIVVSISTSPPPEVEDICASRDEMGSQNTAMEPSILVQNLEPPTQPTLPAESADVFIAKTRPDIVSSPAHSAGMVPAAIRRLRTSSAMSPMMPSMQHMADQLRADTRTPALSIGSDTEAPSGTEDEGFFVRVQHKRSPLSPRSDSFSPLKTIVVKPLSIVDTNNALHLNMDEGSIDDNVRLFE